MDTKASLFFRDKTHYTFYLWKGRISKNACIFNGKSMRQISSLVFPLKFDFFAFFCSHKDFRKHSNTCLLIFSETIVCQASRFWVQLPFEKIFPLFTPVRVGFRTTLEHVFVYFSLEDHTLNFRPPTSVDIEMRLSGKQKIWTCFCRFRIRISKNPFLIRYQKMDIFSKFDVSRHSGLSWSLMNRSVTFALCVYTYYMCVRYK